MSLRVDLPKVWHGLGRWDHCGVDECTFSCILRLLCHFCNDSFVWGTWRLPPLFLSWGVPHRMAGAQHLVSEPAHSPFVGAPSSNAKRQVARFAACAQSTRTAAHIFEVHWSICSTLQRATCLNYSVFLKFVSFKKTLVYEKRIAESYVKVYADFHESKVVLMMSHGQEYFVFHVKRHHIDENP